MMFDSTTESIQWFKRIQIRNSIGRMVFYFERKQNHFQYLFCMLNERKKKETKIQKSHTKMQIEKSITQMKIIKKKNWTFA